MDLAKEDRHRMVGPAGLWRMKRAFQIEFLRKAGMQPGHMLLDIGCGTLRGGVPLIDYLDSGHYVGIDVREEIIEQAKMELDSENLSDKRPVLMHFEDISLLQVEWEFDFIWAYSVFIHLTDEILIDVLKFSKKHLNSNGRVLANVNIGESKTQEPLTQPGSNGEASKTCNVFPVNWRPIEFYQEAAMRCGLTLTDLGSIEQLGFGSGHPPHDQHQVLSFAHG